MQSKQGSRGPTQIIKGATLARRGAIDVQARSRKPPCLTLQSSPGPLRRSGPGSPIIECLQYIESSCKRSRKTIVPRRPSGIRSAPVPKFSLDAARLKCRLFQLLCATVGRSGAADCRAEELGPSQRACPGRAVFAIAEALWARSDSRRRRSPHLPDGGGNFPVIPCSEH